MPPETGIIGSEYLSWLMIEDAAIMTSTVKRVKDMGGNLSALYLGIGLLGFNEAVNMTKTSTQLNNTVDNLVTHLANTSNPHSVTKTQVGLGNVVNLDTSTTANITDSSNKRFATDAQLVLIGTALQPANIDDTVYGVSWNTDTTHSASKNKLYAKFELVATAISTAQSAAQSYADSLVVGLLDDRGNWDASVNTYPTSGGSGTAGAILKGDLFTISVGGTMGTKVVTVGDVARALVDTPGQTDGNWAITENNFGYVAENSANKSTDDTLAANSDALYTSQKAIKTYLSVNYQPLDPDLTTLAALTATTDNFIVSVASAWASRTPAQVKTTLSLNNVENTALSTWTGSANITTLGTITTGTWNATAIGPTKGGTGLTTYTAGDLIYSNSSNSLAKLGIGSDGQVLTLASGLPTWAAAAGGAGALSALTAMTGNNTLANAAYLLAWNWDTATTTNPITFGSTSLTTGHLISITAPALTSGTALDIELAGNATSGITGLKGISSVLTGSNNGSTQSTYAGYFVNTRTGTTSNSVAIYGSSYTGSTGVITDYALELVTRSNAGVRIGDTGDGATVAFWSKNSGTPTSNNYFLISTGTDTSLNAATGLNLRVGAATIGRVTSAGMYISGSISAGGSSVPTITHLLCVAGTTTKSSANFATGTLKTTAAAGDWEYSTPTLYFTNGGAQRQEIPQIQQKRVSTQFDKTSSTSLSDITGLSVTLVAGQTYRFTAILYTTANVAGGVKFAIAGTATATAIVYDSILQAGGAFSTLGTSRATALGTAVSDSTTTTAGTCYITGLITCNAAGTLTVQFAQNASSGSASSVLVGSEFEIKQIA